MKLGRQIKDPNIQRSQDINKTFKCYQCNFCPRIMLTLDSFKEHFKLRHSEDNNNSDSVSDWSSKVNCIENGVLSSTSGEESVEAIKIKMENDNNSLTPDPDCPVTDNSICNNEINSFKRESGSGPSKRKLSISEDQGNCDDADGELKKKPKLSENEEKEKEGAGLELEPEDEEEPQSSKSISINHTNNRPDSDDEDDEKESDIEESDNENEGYEEGEVYINSDDDYNSDFRNQETETDSD